LAVTKRPNGWQVRVRDLEKRFSPTKTFDNKREAERYEAELLVGRERGARAQSKELREYTMAEYWDKWSQEFRIRVSDGWKLSQDQMWRDHLAPTLGRFRVVEVTRTEIAASLLVAQQRASALRCGFTSGTYFTSSFKTPSKSSKSSM
jgi:hypothetical protein